MYIEENTMDVRHIPTIVDRVPCETHNAPLRKPCWSIETKSEEQKSAICNTRATQAGYVGAIQPASLRSNARKKA